MIEEMNASPSSGRRVALLIGIDRYERGVPTLCNAVRDIEAVGQVLCERHGYQVELVRDEQATCQSLRERIGALTQQLEERDRLILYFAGHGLAEELRTDMTGPQGYILLHDADASDSKTFMAMTELRDLLSGLHCRHLLLLLDCCFAGAFRWSQNRNLVVRGPTLYRERYERYLRDPAWQVITSAAADERAADWLAGKMLGSRDAKGMNSPFAEALCAALGREVETTDLRVGGQRGDGVILASELHLYIDNVFTVREKQQKKALQKPQIWSICGRDKGQFLFDVPGRTPSLPSALELHEQNNPYRGLQIYREQDTALFFGRKKATDALFAQVKTSRLLLVSGASGTGKSSLVRAGLVPLLKSPKKQNDQKEEKEQKWKILESKRPGTSAQSVFGEWAEELEKGSGSLPLAIERWRREHGEEKLFLFIDQLEELITLGSALSPFQSSLSDVLRAGDANVCVVMTLRSDFEPHFAELTKALPVTRFPVPPLSLEELRDVIELPASDRVLYFDPPQIVDKLLREVADTPAPLPLLSFVLSEMYRAALLRPLDRSLSETDYQSLGGVNGALSKRADAIYESYKDPAEQASFRYLMLRMVVPGELARRRVLESELVFADPAEQKRIDRIKKRLIEERLLLVDTDGQKQPFVEPAHDKLVMGWAQLRKWIAEDTAYALQHSVNLAQRGHEAGGQLWTFDSRRAQAAQALRKTPQRWNRAEADFIRRSQRLFYGTWGAAGALVVFILATLGVWLVRERRNSAQLKKDKSEIEEKNNQIHQQLLSDYVDRGQQLLFQPGKANEGLLWLHRAYSEGSTDAMLPYLLKTGMRTVDATRAVLTGHGDEIVTAEYSPDGRSVVTASGEKTARVFDAATGKLLVELKGHRDLINHAAFSPDGQRIVTASDDNTARIWDAATGQLVKELAGHEDAVSLAKFSPDGERIVTASSDESAIVWDAVSGNLIKQLSGDPDKEVVHVAFSPEGRHIVTVALLGNVRIWDASSLRLVKALRCHGAGAFHASFSPDGRRVATACRDGSAEVFDVGKGRLLLTLRRQNAMLGEVAWSHDGKMLLTASLDGSLARWDASSGELMKLHREANAMTRASFSPDGSRLIASGTDNIARVFSARGRETPKIIGPSDSAVIVRELSGHSDDLSVATYSPDGRSILTASSDHTARIWDAADRALLAEIDPVRGEISDAVIRADGRRIITIGDDKIPWLWDVVAGRRLVALKAPTGSVSAPSFSPDGRRIVASGDGPILYFFDGSGGQYLSELKVSPSGLEGAELSADGRRVVVGYEESKTQVLDVPSGRRVCELDGQYNAPNIVTFSPDGRRIVTSDVVDRKVRIWDSEKGVQLGELREHPSPIRSVAFSPNGRQIVTACEDNLARIFDVDTQELFMELRGHLAAVHSAEWSHDGRFIVTASADETVRIWDASSGRQLSVMEGLSAGGVKHAVFSPDGRQIISSSEHQAGRIWEFTPETRSAETLAKLIRCYIPARFEREGSGVIVAAPPDPTQCQGK